MKSYEEVSLEGKKSEILLESNKPGVVIADVARRYGINPSTLYNWRSEENNENLSGSGASFVELRPDFKSNPVVETKSKISNISVKFDHTEMLLSGQISASSLCQILQILESEC